LIFAVVERIGLGHVIRRVQRRLDPEQVTGIPDVSADVRGHRCNRLEDTAKDFA